MGHLLQVLMLPLDQAKQLPTSSCFLGSQRRMLTFGVLHDNRAIL